MNCILVADKASSILLEEFVGKSSSLNLVGTFSDPVSARNQLLKRQDIDLLFIDLDTLETDSFDFINNLGNHPNIIMVSSSDQNALKAFDFNVIDYMLKPVTYSRFCKAVDKAVKYYSHKEVSNRGDNEIFIKKGSSLVKLKLKDIIYIEALENYATINTNDQRFTIHFTMKGIENQLPSEVFIRIHRSFIVNKTLIHTIKEDSMDLHMGNSFKNVPVGKSFRDSLLNDINLIAR
jgi:DNA-binding LytR/AlgR family response regulator